MISPDFLDIRQLTAAFRRRSLSPVEALDAFLARIDRLNPSLNAFLSLIPQARTEARAAEQAYSRRAREPRALEGVPIAIKDLILTKESLTTAGSRTFGAGVASEVDAPVVRRLRRAGAVIIGRTNLHELALGVTSANEHFGPCRNPYDTARVAGGSSGGSAVAVAAGLSTAAIGTDTRGSIRIPASCCGIVGLKATYGLVPTDGVIPLSPSLDHVGPMTRTVGDAALLLEVMAALRGEPLQRAARSRRKLRVGISEYHLRDLDSSVQRVIAAALRELRKLGARVVNMPMPFLEEVQRASGAITAPEAVHYHDERLRANPDGFGPLVRQRLEGGYKTTATQYLTALQVRAEARRTFAAAFGEIDVLVGATLPAPPPPIAEHGVRINGTEANTVESFTRLNSPQNMAGVPAMSLPAGFTREGLPVGLQLIAGEHRETLLVALASEYERATGWHGSRPPAPYGAPRS